MTTGTGKVTAGESFARNLSSRLWNGFVDAATFARESRRGSSSDRLGRDLDSGLIRIKNDSGQVIHFGEVLGAEINVAPPAYSGDGDSPGFKAKPAMVGVIASAGVYRGGTTPDHNANFVIARETIPAGKIGIAAAAGIAVAKINRTSAFHLCAVPTVGDVKLKSTRAGGAQIISPFSATTGEAFYVVRLGCGTFPTSLSIQTPAGGIPAGGSAVCNVVRNDGLAGWQPVAGDSETVYNLTGSAVGGSKIGKATLTLPDWTWIIDVESC